MKKVKLLYRFQFRCYDLNEKLEEVNWASVAVEGETETLARIEVKRIVLRGHYKLENAWPKEN